MSDDESPGEGKTGPETVADGADESEDDDGISRRMVLGGGLALVGAGAGSYLLFGGSGGSDTPNSTETPGRTETPGPTETPGRTDGEDRLRTPFGVWRELQSGLRESPDHLPGTATALVQARDPAELFSFVRDAVALKPPELEGNTGFTSRVDGGPNATLRAGMGTPREKADLLARLLERADYESEVVAYDRSLSAERAQELYLDGPVQTFDPGFGESDLARWGDLMGEDPHSPDEITLVDEDGAESEALAGSIRDALPDGAAGQALAFDPDSDVARVPVVRFRDSTGDGAGATTDAETDDSSGADPDWQYADLFHADESFGSLTDPSAVSAAPDRDVDQVTVSLETARIDAPNERVELVSGTWEATELAGRHLQIGTLPGRSLIDNPRLTFDDVSTFVPVLAVTDPGTDVEADRNRSVVDDPFDLLARRTTVDDAGTLRRDGVVVHEGDEEWDLVVETPDGTRHTVTPIEGDVKPKEYYAYDTEQRSSSFTPDKLERQGETVTFLYRNTSSGRLSLFVINDHPENGVGGTARLTFDGVRGAGWQAQDGPLGTGIGDYDVYESLPEGGKAATWKWKDGFTDGGALGAFSLPFDVELTHEAAWEETNESSERTGIDRWVFLDGDNPDDPIELATFDDETRDVSARLFSDLVSETESVREPMNPPSADDVESVEVTASGEPYPEIRVAVDARDDAGGAVANLPPGAVAILEDGQPIAAELEPTADGEGTHTFAYRTPNRESDDRERSVTVDIEGGDEGSTTYAVPADATDPRTEAGLCGLYLRVTVGDTTARRTLAGWDPEFDGGRDPTQRDHDAVVSALWGRYAVSFETAGVPSSLTLDDELNGKLSKEPLHEARKSGDIDTMRSVAGEGDQLVSQSPFPFHPRLPNRSADDTLTYGVGLRSVLVGARPVFGDTVEKREVDMLDTSTIRTITDDDPARAFGLTADRTTRLAVMERTIFETSTAGLLDGSQLVSAGDAMSEMSDDVANRLSIATTRRSLSEGDYRLTAATGDTAAYWHVDGGTGEVVGVLPDGSGGGKGEGIIELLERIDRTVKLLDEATSEASDKLSGKRQDVATYYGQTLSRLYAIAAGSIATISTKTFEEEVARAISSKVCDLAGTIADGDNFPAASKPVIAAFMNNIHTAKNHSTDAC